MGSVVTNRVKEAVTKLGGPTKTAIAIRCSSAAIHKWVAEGRVPSSLYATRLAEISGVPIRDLVGDSERAAG